MRRTFFSVMLFALGICVLTTCTNYDFPETPYPKVTTSDVVGVKTGKASFQGSVTQLGEEPITNHGFVWSLSPGANLIASDNVQLGPMTSTGVFSAEVGITMVQGKEYYVKAFLSTATYTVYGAPIMFIGK